MRRQVRAGCPSQNAYWKEPGENCQPAAPRLRGARAGALSEIVQHRRCHSGDPPQEGKLQGLRDRRTGPRLSLCFPRAAAQPGLLDSGYGCDMGSARDDTNQTAQR
jgi:hypothetical protein